MLKRRTASAGFFPQIWDNRNIRNNDFVTNDNIIHIGKLTNKRKLELFSKILNDGSRNKEKRFSKEEIEEQNNFLNKIPAFPLDISIAAHYLKATKITYKQYIKYISNLPVEFVSSQKNIIQDAGQYKKTRYDIISLAIDHVIKTNPNFQELLLFVSMIGSKNIPKELLLLCQDELTIEKLFYELRKYSLITKIYAGPDIGFAISMHRSTQKILKKYLLNTKTLINQPSFNLISSYLNNYIETSQKSGNFTKLRLIQSHSEMFLRNEFIASTITKNNISIIKLFENIGEMYIELGDYKTAKKWWMIILENFQKYYRENHIKIANARAMLGRTAAFLGEFELAKNNYLYALPVYKNHYGQEDSKVGWILHCLGNIYKDLGLFKKAFELHECAFQIVKARNGESHVFTAGILGNLSSSYKHLGKYKQAEQYINKSLQIYINHFGQKDYFRTAQMLVNKGSINERLGNYETAKKILHDSLDMHENLYGANHPKIAWNLVHLGNVYKHLEEHNKAKILLEKSLTIHKKYFGSNHIKTAWSKAHLGAANIYLGDFSTAEALLNEAITVYNKHYKDNNIKTAQVLLDLGILYLEKGDLEKGEKVMNKSLIIFKKNNHPNQYKCLESLSDLNHKQYEQATNIAQKVEYKEKAIDYLKQSITVIKKYFPEDSPHIKRIREKLDHNKSSL